MKARVKFIIINHRAHAGTYKKEVHEEVWENVEPEDPHDLGEWGKFIHDQEGMGRNRFVKVVGLELLGE